MNKEKIINRKNKLIGLFVLVIGIYIAISSFAFADEFDEKANLEKYDIKEYVSAETQGSTNICWTFANKGMVESYLAMKNMGKYKFSARHMDYVYSKYNDINVKRELLSAAAYTFGIDYFTKNYGPVKEEKFPWNTSTDKKTPEELKENIENIYARDFVYFPSIYKSRNEKTMTYKMSKYLTDWQEDISEAKVMNIRKEIKKHIAEYGGVVAGIKQGSNINDLENEYLYFEENEPGEIDHSVLIIGWDDKFCCPLKNRVQKGSSRPPLSTGAWLVRDSSRPKNDQFIYVSYDDKFIERSITGLERVEVGKKYDVHAVDTVGISRTLLLKYDLNQTMENDLNIKWNTTSKIEGMYGYGVANVYKRDNTKKENIEKIGFYAYGPGLASVEYIPIESFKSGKYKEGAKLLGYKHIQGDKLRYVTIDLDKKLLLNDEKEFVIALRMYYPKFEGKNEGTNEPGKAIINMPVEKAQDFDATADIPMYESSYIYHYGLPLERPEKLVVKGQNMNIPIRVYTTKQEEKPAEDQPTKIGVRIDTARKLHVDILDKDGIASIKYKVNNKKMQEKKYTKDISKVKLNLQLENGENTVYVEVLDKLGNKKILNDKFNVPKNEEKPNENNNQGNKPNDKPTAKKRYVTFRDGKKDVKIELKENGFVKEIVRPADRPGYTFAGWTPDPFTTKVSEGTVFYPRWILNNKQNTQSSQSNNSNITSSSSSSNNNRVDKPKKKSTEKENKTNSKIPMTGIKKNGEFIIIALSLLTTISYVLYKKTGALK